VFEPSFPEPLSLYKKVRQALREGEESFDASRTERNRPPVAQRLYRPPLCVLYDPVRKGIISVFMMHDGGLIWEGPADGRHAHLVRLRDPRGARTIYERLEDEHSILRRSGDASMLAHAILDISASSRDAKLTHSRRPRD
jgi:hypothetical protein